MYGGNLAWDFSDSEIVQMDGNRFIGQNVGSAYIHGRYRGETVSLRVNVGEPMNGMIDIIQRFYAGTTVSLFAGGEYRDWINGNLQETEFVSTHGIAIAENGAMYIADSGRIRRIYNGISETINLGHFRANVIRTNGNNVYMSTTPWSDQGVYYAGIIRITENGGEVFLQDNTVNTYIRDFYITNGYIYAIRRNVGTGNTQFVRINLQNSGDIQPIVTLPDEATSMAANSQQFFFAIGDNFNEEARILTFTDGELLNFAGAEQRAFIDGTAPLFYRPTRIHYNNGGLYVWDFNTLRRISIENGVVREALSVVGLASPVYNLNGFPVSQPAEQIILPYSYLTDFVHTPEGILITDPKRGVIWRTHE
jgi:hypothetical protein